MPDLRPSRIVGAIAAVAAASAVAFLIADATPSAGTHTRLVAAAAPSAPAPSGLDDVAVAALPPRQQARLLQPLRRVAGDIDRLGRTTPHDGYTGVALHAGTGVVDVFATSEAAGHSLLTAARAADPSAAWPTVRVRTARYSRAALEAAAAALISGRDGADVTSVAIPVTGSGLDVGVAGPRPAMAFGTGTDVHGVPARFHVTPRRQPKSWAADKWHDSAPFIGGDVLTSNGKNRCTAGLPAVRRSDGTPVMITAAHCFSIGTRVYTGAGTPGDYGNGKVGNYVGTVRARNRTWDAEEVVGANNNADESDTTGWKRLTSVAYSYVGDFVCQDGAASFYLGHPTPCGIKVTDGDLWFRIGGHWARGVEGVDVRNGWGSHNGDSGGTVFAVEPHGVRQARGIISSGGADGTPAQKRVDWTEAVDIFRAYHLKLNPHT